MANEYATVPDLKEYLRLPGDDDDTSLAFVVEDAAGAVDAYCGRRFYADTVATARVYEPIEQYELVVDDFWTTSGLLVKGDYDGDGTFETTIAAANYELFPTSGGSEGVEIYPYTMVRLLFKWWPIIMVGSRRGRAQITAQWGWSAVPRPVYRASLIVAAELFRRKDAPLGLSAGGADFGSVRVGNDTMRQVASLLGPFRAGSHVGVMA